MANTPDPLITDWLDDQLAKVCLPHVFAGRSIDSRLPMVNRAWHQVRCELEEVGLLYDAGDDKDGYLDQIELVVLPSPSIRAAAFVFDTPLQGILKAVGFEAGSIYLPADMPHESYAPGNTLVDIIRHEYAHAWYWLEPDFVDAPWFRRAFGDSYLSEERPLELWQEVGDLLPAPGSKAWECRFRSEFVSKYAATKVCEDFAESFMFYLRYRKSLDRFRNRSGVYRKLKAIELTVSRARRELGI